MTRIKNLYTPYTPYYPQSSDPDAVHWIADWYSKRPTQLKNTFGNSNNLSFTQIRPNKNETYYGEETVPNDRKVEYELLEYPTTEDYNNNLYKNLVDRAAAPSNIITENMWDGAGGTYSNDGIHFVKNPKYDPDYNGWLMQQWSNGNYVDPDMTKNIPENEINSDKLKNTIMYNWNAMNDRNDSMSTRIHERTHAMVTDPLLNDIDYGLRQNIKKRVRLKNGTEEDPYWDNPNEIYSRMNEFRYKAGLKPTDVITKKTLEQHRDILEDKSLDRYDDESLIDLLNNVAYNNQNTNNVRYAARGIKRDIGDPDDIEYPWQKNTTVTRPATSPQYSMNVQNGGTPVAPYKPIYNNPLANESGPTRSDLYKYNTSLSGNNQNKTGKKIFPLISKWIDNYRANRQTKTPPTEQDKEDRLYNTNVLLNTLGSTLKNAPLVDSVLGYFQKKRDTPDYSDIENAKNYALRPTNVYRYSPTHITGNMKFNPYDYTEEANKINAASAAGQNLLARQSRGNFNALAANINNMLVNTSKASGEAAQKAWQTNETQRMAVAQENRRADEYNANADNNAESAYIQARNQAAIQDKTNGYNALNNYAAQKYARNAAYQQQLDAKRNEMIGNLGTYGQNAFDANQANTDQSYNYWKDPYGRLHFISGINGARPVNNTVANNTVAFDNDLWKQAYDTFTDDEKEQVGKMNDAERRNFIIDKIRNKTKTA